MVAVAACAPHLDREIPVGDRFDGVYAGTATEDPACGTETRAISFQVTGSVIVAHGGHRRSRFAGTVSFTGQIDLQNALGGNAIIGSINGAGLVATELVTGPSHKKHVRTALEDPLATQCSWRYEAARGAVPLPVQEY